MKVKNTYAACVDCYMTAAVGAPDDIDPARALEVERALGALGPNVVALGEEAEERADFSWSPCQVCGSTLGGAREGLAVLEE